MSSIILGINSAYHESSICLIRDGKIVFAVEEERLNRIKHGKPARIDNPHELPIQSLQHCLNDTGIDWQDIDLIGYALSPDKRLINKDYIDAVVPVAGNWGSEEGENTFFDNLMQIPRALSLLANVDLTNKFHWIDHHLCHAASAFFVSPFEESAVLVVDGIGEFESTTLYHGQGNKLRDIKSICYPNSLGFLWEKICEFLGFSEYDACKLMGLAAYGDPNTYKTAFEQIVHFENKQFFIDNSITCFRSDIFTNLEKLLGPQRRPGDLIDCRHHDIAATLQQLTEDIMLNLAYLLHEQTRSPNLCIAGGVGLNCVANTVLQQKSPFNEIYIQPAANDAGTAIGAAYVLWHHQLEKPRSYIMESPYVGPEYSDADIELELKRHNLNLPISYHEDIEMVVAKLLADSNVVAWFQGQMEFGPRALGNRSLLADPRLPNIRDILNHKVKHRESFRPFAPSVLAEKVHEWFKFPRQDMPSNFMLFAYESIEEKRGLIPGVIHTDGTSRVQTVSKSLNPKYYKLIAEFEKLTGVPVLLNTSFNDSEPIVCSPRDALNTFLKTKIDALALGNYLVRKTVIK